MIDISIFDKIKHKPDSYNHLVTPLFRTKISEYYKDKKLPVHLMNGYTEYTKMLYEKSPQNLIQHMTYFDVYDVSTNEIVCFDYEQFLSGTQYLTCSSYSYRCDSCDDTLIVSLYNDRIEISHKEDNECFEMKDYTVSFKVPKNGKMVVSDWLGSILPDPHKEISLNSEKGRYIATKNAESNGFVHFCVGNSCPSLYKLPDGSIIVAGSSTVYDEENNVTRYPGAVEICNVCTDLWWVTMASEDHCLELEKKGGQYIEGEDIDLEPGTWECTVHVGNDHYKEPYATFKKVK